MERASDKISDPELSDQKKAKRLEEEGSNELTMNSAVLAPKALGNMFIKEKEYNPSELSTPTGQNGPPEQEMMIMPPTIMRQHTNEPN